MTDEMKGAAAFVMEIFGLFSRGAGQAATPVTLPFRSRMTRLAMAQKRRKAWL
jgi:hypothetical protein